MSAKQEILEVLKKENIQVGEGQEPFYVLYLDDEPELLPVVADLIEQFGFKCFSTESTATANDFLLQNQQQTVFIISDYRMEPTDGFEFRKQTIEICPDIPFLILSAHVTKDMALLGIDLKISGFLDKPFREDAFLELLKKEGVARIRSIKEDRELLHGFIDEAEPILEQAEELALIFENAPNDIDSINKCFGLIHTLKGSSGYFKPKTLHQFVHRFEDLLKKIQRGETTLSPEVMSSIFRSLDFIKQLLREYKTGHHGQHALEDIFRDFFDFQAHGTRSQVGHSEPVTKEISPKTPEKDVHNELRVSVALLDQFMQTSGEMTVIRNMINKCVKSIEAQFPRNREVLMLAELLEELHKINGGIQTQITNLRKVPIYNILKPVQRVVRDVSKSLGKEAELIVLGDELAVDTAIAGVLNNSLVHLVRNSLDHGLESPQEREQAGKSRKGKVTIQASQKNDAIIISIEDDGRGINEASIQKKLVKNGTHTAEEAALLSKQELYAMIFESGFSTAEKVTDVSGRGVGMSMVKDCVKSIGGQIEIESFPQKGSRFTLCLPIPKSVLIRDCLFVTTNQMLFGIPQDEIMRVLQSDQKVKSDIFCTMGTHNINYNGQLVPVISLSKLLGMQESNEHLSDMNIVIIGNQIKKIALRVDRILDIEDTVIKPLQGLNKQIEVFQGAAHIGDGGIGLILSAEGLLNKSGVNSIAQEDITRHVSNNRMDEISTELLLFSTGNRNLYALPHTRVHRIEEIKNSDIKTSGKTKVVPYRNQTLSLIDFSGVLEANQNEFIQTIVIQEEHRFIGLPVLAIHDIATVEGSPFPPIKRQYANAGNYIIKEKIVTLLGLDEILQPAS